MKVLHTRQDVLDLAAAHAPTSAAARRIREQGGQVYRLPEGYLVEVEGRFRDWLIRLDVNESGWTWVFTYPDRLPEGAKLITREVL